MRDLRRSVVRVVDGAGRTAGTAFFTFPKGLLVTATHVLEGAQAAGPAHLEFCPRANPEPVRLTATVCPEWTAASGKEDIAVLRLNQPLPADAVALYLSRSIPRLGEVVDSFGYSAHNSVHGMPANGSLVGFTRDPHAGLETFVFASDTIARGFSGGPCVSRETGEVVGVVGAITTADATSRWGAGAFVIPASTALGICPELEVGIPDLVKALSGTWADLAEPFQKYFLASAEARDTDAFELPSVETVDGEEGQAVALRDVLGPDGDRRIVVVVGAAGSGKSRLLAELARIVWSSPSELGLQEQLVPFLVTAQSVLAAPGTSPSERLAGALKRDGRVLSAKSLDADAVQKVLDGGQFRCAILIDGVDEIANPIERKDFVNLLAHHGRALVESGHLVIVASRPLQEVGSERLKAIGVTYRLPLLAEESCGRLARGILGDAYPGFAAAVEETGLARSLDTPLLLRLATTLYRRKPAEFPNDVLGLYQSFLSLLASEWKGAPRAPEAIVRTLSSLALRSLDAGKESASQAPWLRDTDRALEAALADLMPRDGGPWEPKLREAQETLNFAFDASSLLLRSGQTVQWSHLLLRDYLVASHLDELALRETALAKRYLVDGYAKPLWREALVLFVTMQARRGRADELLFAVRDAEGGFSENLMRFGQDCIHRGTVLSAEFLAGYFENFERYAVADQKSFGSCASLFSDDRGMFWRLLKLQRIPQARAAIERAVKRAPPNSLMGQWPNSEASRTFTPQPLYRGPLATLEPLHSRS